MEKFGEQRTRLMADISRNLLVYPNLMIIDSIDITVKYWPITPELMEVTAWQLAPKEEKPELLARRLTTFLPSMVREDSLHQTMSKRSSHARRAIKLKGGMVRAIQRHAPGSDC